MIRLLAISFLSIITMIVAATMLTSKQPGDTFGSAPAAAEPVARARNGNRSYYADAGSPTVLRRDSSGQFHVTAQVNGQDTRFLVDTGADVVALTVEEAEALNIDFDPGEFQEVARTASGAGMGQFVTIDRMEVGGMEFSAVPAVVVEGLEVNLLGQSVLRQMGKVELKGDRMVFHKS